MPDKATLAAPKKFADAVTAKTPAMPPSIASLPLHRELSTMSAGFAGMLNCARHRPQPWINGSPFNQLLVGGLL